MAFNILTTSNTNGCITRSDLYDGQSYYAEQERRYREEMERERQRMYNSAYNINTDTYGGMSAQQMEEPKLAKKVGKVEPDYLNNKLLLLES